MATKIGNIRGPTGLTGPTGPNGVNAFTTASAGFTVPPIGSTVAVTVANASWMVLGELLWVDQAGGGVGQPGIMQVQAISGNLVTLLNISAAPTPLVSADTGNLSRLGSDNLVYTPNALASASARGLLGQLSGNTTDFVDGTNNCQNLASATQPTIWSARLRSYNSVGNPNFEVTQRNIGNLITNPGHGSFLEDRWQVYNANALGGSYQMIQTATPVNLPGTSFGISKGSFRFTTLTQKTSLAATDLVGINQLIEGPQFRELANDVHSVSILCRSSISNFAFGLSIRDGGSSTKGLTKLCQLGAANTITLIPLANLPVFPSGNFSVAPGVNSYYITITLAAGSTNTSPANDTWQTGGSLYGATGQGNILATLNATFDAFFVQHEPGPQCTTLQDLPFTQNLTACQRYFTKSWHYSLAVGGAAFQANPTFVANSATQAAGYVPFPQRMAKSPTITAYNPQNGTVNQAYDLFTGTAITLNANFAINDSGFSQIGAASGMTAGHTMAINYTADTGW